MKSAQQFEDWFRGQYGGDPRELPTFDEPGLRQEWTDGLYAGRELRDAQDSAISLRLELESRVNHGTMARTALDAAERWQLLHEAARAAWSEALRLLK